MMGALTPAELDLALGAGADIAVWRPGFLDARRRRAARRSASGRGSTSSTTPAWAGWASATRTRSPALVDDGRRRRGARAGRPLDPLRDRRRARLAILRRAARALPRAGRCRCASEHPGLLLHAANSAATLREPALPLRHGPLRDRHLRARPVRRGPGGARPRAGARAALLRRRREARSSAGASAGYGRTLAAPTEPPGSGCCRSATATASGGRSRTTPRCSSAAAATRWSARSRWTT